MRVISLLLLFVITGCDFITGVDAKPKPPCVVYQQSLIMRNASGDSVGVSWVAQCLPSLSGVS